MEALLAQHRKEARDLQSRVTQKKKQASKKTRKGVNDECDRLEAELKQKHQAEIVALDGDHDADSNAVEVAEEIQNLTLQADDEKQEGDSVHGDSGMTLVTDSAVSSIGISQSSAAAAKVEAPKKGNRQKARLARRAAEQEELVKQAEEEAQNLPDMKQQERDRMLDSMKLHGLQEKEIRADGHCLYSAVADQLEQLSIPIQSAPDDQPAIRYKSVRLRAAEYIEQHQDDFVPFLEEPLPEYVHKVRDTAEWGGQLELMALAKTFGADINVLQDFGRVERIESGAGQSDKTMWLGYYKHGFGLGEHYNSLRKAA